MRIIVCTLIVFFCLSTFLIETGKCNGPSSGHIEEFKKFFHEYGGDLAKDFHLPFGNDFSYWGTNRDTFFYKTPDAESKYKEPYWAKADLNEDGIVDRCYLLFSNNDDNLFLYCFISNQENSYRIVKVSSAEKNMGVHVIKNDNVNYYKLLLFEFEGHGYLYHWSEEKKTFILE